MTRIKFVTWHPILFAVFPIISLLAHNIIEIQAPDILRSLLVSIFVTTLLVFLLKFFSLNWHKAALIVTSALILFFSYGHVYNYLKLVSLFAIGRHRLLTPLWLVIFGIIAWWTINTKRDLKIVTYVFNIIVLVALIIPTTQLYLSIIEENQTASIENPEPSVKLRVNEGETPPDIYYIILDAYSRDDVLQEMFDYDNSSFLNELAEIGFYVAHCSQSNYAQTRLSLASALNSNYIEELDPRYSGEGKSRAGMSRFIKYSATRKLLENLGYTTVAYETGFKWTEIGDADIYLSPNSIAGSFLDITGGINKFEALLISTTGGLLIFDVASLLPKYIQQPLNYPNQIHRNRVLFVLENLEKLSTIPGPKFVFAHIVSPHPPYVLGPQGEIVKNADDEMGGYRDQIIYLNSRLIPLLKKIITNSETAPIIIIQADHGAVNTLKEERMAILNAYYLPNGGNHLLYNHITPINSFRLIFNYYFDANFEILEDTSYYSGYYKPYIYTIMPDSRPGCTQ